MMFKKCFHLSRRCKFLCKQPIFDSFGLGLLAKSKCTHANGHAQDHGEILNDVEVNDFNLKKVVLMRKITRYEYEKQWNDNCSEDELRAYLTAKGSDYDGLVARHDEYFQVLEDVNEHLIKRGVQVDVVRRFDYGTNVINWADAVFTVGGDGTFLMAASKLAGHSKPIIGINADPDRSEGYLCLPREESLNFSQSIDNLIDNNFKWKWRQRIRLTISGKCDMPAPVDLHDQELHFPEHRFVEHVREHELHKLQQSPQIANQAPKPLPILSLNEVFIGESLSARVSFYEIGIDGSDRIKQKSSGITICTGTGSTSWFFNINHISRQSIREILKIANELSGSDINTDDRCLLNKLTKRFNTSLTFDQSYPQMAFVVRDPVAKGIFQVHKPRGFCKKMSVKSRMWDAWVVVDGGISFKFNDGAVVDLDMLNEDALRCVQL